MQLIPPDLRAQLIENGARQHPLKGTSAELDFCPVLKLFTPDAGATWLLTELVPDDLDLAFGLCDLGLGSPELGYVRLSELEAVRGPMGLPVERDLHFAPTATLAGYAEAARAQGKIKA